MLLWHQLQLSTQATEFSNFFFGEWESSSLKTIIPQKFDSVTFLVNGSNPDDPTCFLTMLHLINFDWFSSEILLCETESACI